MIERKKSPIRLVFHSKVYVESVPLESATAPEYSNILSLYYFESVRHFGPRVCTRACSFVYVCHSV